jgi:hypothetical protein
MKGLFIKPEKPSEAVKKFKLEGLISVKDKSERTINDEVILLSIKGIILRDAYDKYINATGDFPTFPYYMIMSSFFRRN